MKRPLFLEDIGDDGIARLVLTNSDRRNALDPETIGELHTALNGLASDDRVRVLMLCATGPVFCAGANLDWMRHAAELEREENVKDAAELAALLDSLYRLPKPTIAVVQGPAYGGGLGLIACCDIALAAETAKFALTEVRLGLVPSVISPYIALAMGIRQALRLSLTGETFTARQALELGILHEVVPDELLTDHAQRTAVRIRKGGPCALERAKALFQDMAAGVVDEDLTARTVDILSEVRAGEEAREGISAFFEKRRPSWDSE
jgi:methylglutaconyl-CoA hydratase